MQDESPEKEGADDSAAAEDVGNGDVALRDTREALGLSLDEVAHELHLTRDIVIALEASDYEALGAPVFVRGHLRSYARLLGLSEDAVVESYQASEPEPEEFRTLSTHTVVKPGASLPNFVLIALLLFVMLLGAIYLMMGDSDSPVAPEPVAEPQEDAVEQPPAEAVREQPKADSSTEQQPLRGVASREDFAVEEAQTEVAPEPEVVVAEIVEEPVVEVVPDTQSLVLRFSEECWVEISDSRRRLLYGLEKPDTEVELEGVPPFKLFLGNVSAIEIEVNDRSFEIPAAGRRGNNTARFSLTEADFQ